MKSLIAIAALALVASGHGTGLGDGWPDEPPYFRERERAISKPKASNGKSSFKRKAQHRARMAMRRAK